MQPYVCATTAKPVNEHKDDSPNGRFSPEAMASLRIALKQWMDGGGANDASLRLALHAVTAEARDRGIRAEELLVTLKTTWFAVGGAPNAANSAAVSPNQKRLDELVTACIEAYYS
jgi:hypothetical protein